MTRRSPPSRMKNDSSLIEKPRDNAPQADPRLPVVTTRWSIALGVRPRGLALAREANTLLTWDENGWLYLLNRAGTRQGQVRMNGAVTAAAAADDGSAYLAVGAKGEVWSLGPDLASRWERRVPRKAIAAALDPFGQYAAVADARGNLVLFDRHGRTICGDQAARPLQRLAFVPAAPFVISSADYGLVAAYDLSCRQVWRDGLVANVGGLAVSGNGSQILLACYSEGLQGYNLAGKNEGRRAIGEPCRLVSLSFDGKTGLVAGLTNRLLVLDANGHVMQTHALERPAAAIALAALAEHAYVALADGTVLALGLRD